MTGRDCEPGAPGLVEGVRGALEGAEGASAAAGLLHAVAQAVRDSARVRDVRVQVERPRALPPLPPDLRRLARALVRLAEMAVARGGAGQSLVLRAVAQSGGRQIRFSVSEAFYLEIPVDPEPAAEAHAPEGA